MLSCMSSLDILDVNSLSDTSFGNVFIHSVTQPSFCCCSQFPSGFPGGSTDRESACNAGDLGLIPGLGKSPGEGNGYPFQYSGLENSMEYTVHGVTKSQTQLSNFHVHFSFLHCAKSFQFDVVLFICFCFPHLRRPIQKNIAKTDVREHSVLVALSCPTLCDPMDCSPGSSVHVILQARTLEGVATFFSRGSSQPRD